jgi:predicted extracellular nuclease
VIANHWLAKLGGPMADPRRNEQGAFIGGLVDASRAAAPNRPVVALGDFNSGYGEQAYEHVAQHDDGSTRMQDTPVLGVADADRYTYLFHGQPDMLDHMLVTPDLGSAMTSAAIPHFDSADQFQHENDPTVAAGVSDHDPIVASFDLSKLGAAAPRAPQPPPHG